MTDPPIDFVQVAQGFGLSATRVVRADQIQAAVRAGIQSGKPNLVEVVIDAGYA
jgi:benzoylformate decarboxylase